MLNILPSRKTIRGGGGRQGHTHPGDIYPLVRTLLGSGEN